MLLALALITLAHPDGVTAYSGMQAGTTCNSCHAGGTAPTVTITGPATLMAGASATYTVTITGGAGVRAGFDAAVTGGTLIAGAGTKVMGGEVTHSAPGTFNAGAASFSFTLKAPSSDATLMLYAAGLSASGGMGAMGDMDGEATLQIAVGAGGAAPQAPVTPTTPAPAPSASPSVNPNTLSGGLVEGGCSMSGGLPFALAALAWLSRRRPSKK